MTDPNTPADQTHYLLLVGRTNGSLSQEVCNYLYAGWELYGSPSYVAFSDHDKVFLQAVIKPRKETP